MKKTLPLVSAVIVLLCAWTEARAQVTLTSATSTPLYGDTFHYISHLDSVLAVEHSGANQTWDFSMAGGTVWTSAFDSVHSSNSHLQFPQNNLVQQQVFSPGNDQFYLTSQTALQLVGYTTPIFGFYNFIDLQDVLRFPMSFGDSFTDTYSGPGDTGISPATISGTATVTADGHGTLILPYTTVSNVLRIKTVNNYQVQPMSGQPYSESDTSYTWYDMANRNYLARYFNQYGQRSTQYLAQSDLVIGIGSDDIRDDFLKVYPNPTSGMVNLGLDISTPTNVSIVLSDLIGKMVFSKKATTGPSMSPIVLDLAGLPKGIYILSVNDGNEIIGRQRLVVR